MKKFLVICFTAFSFCAYSQQKVVMDSIYNAQDVDIKPEFKDGTINFYKFVGKNFRTPEEDKAQGKVVLDFIVESDGAISDIKVTDGVGYGAGEEAVRVMKLSPPWIPAMKNGKPVRCRFKMPITIQHGD
ncbi:energy transducer TonB [Flavobacterium silvaticum]|uniref:Energy transducer TonB n=1 Tax=Flavobacterium silvaticum TaxID=1852020 RepID=A0A972JFS0_9FLAO|nr:energy transducer TonB [Flavobacterium silvaticum]NMH28274.1 energy transducer TonB [Flavobacterium silvaticum]